MGSNFLVKLIFTIFGLFFYCALSTFSQQAAFDVYPLCNIEGNLTCPEGFKADCLNEGTNTGQPKCIVYNGKFIPGCWTFTGINKIDLDFNALMLFPGAMVEVIGGGETYKLNRETIGCKKL